MLAPGHQRQRDQRHQQQVEPQRALDLGRGQRDRNRAGRDQNRDRDVDGAPVALRQAAEAPDHDRGLQRKPGADPKAVVVLEPACAQRAAVQADALAQRAQAVVGQQAPAATVVAHGHLHEHVAVPVGQQHLGLGSVLRALGRVQRLLQHPVRRQVHAGGQRGRLAVHLQVHRQPVGAGALDQRLRLLQRRLRGQRRPGVVASQHAQQPPHLHQRVAAGLLDRGQRRVGGGGGGDGQRGAHRAGLDHHRADVVGHQGLQLLGDPAALGVDGALPAAAAVGLQAGGQAAQLLLHRQPPAHDPARHQRRGQQRQAPQHGQQERLLVIGQRQAQGGRHVDHQHAQPTCAGPRCSGQASRTRSRWPGTARSCSP